MEEEKKERVIETKPLGIKVIIRKFSSTIRKMDEEAEK